MSNPRAHESTPLLEREAPASRDGSGPASRAMAFRVATITSFVAGVLTLMLAAVCMVLVSRAPVEYTPPYQIYYTFAPVIGFVSEPCRPSGPPP